VSSKKVESSFCLPVARGTQSLGLFLPRENFHKNQSALWRWSCVSKPIDLFSRPTATKSDCFSKKLVDPNFGRVAFSFLNYFFGASTGEFSAFL
jgi:hypothetical protein